MKLSILGSTGSIGTQALEVVEELKGIRDITVTGISGNRNLTLLEEQIRRFRPPYAAVPDEGLAKQLALSVADTGCRVLSGQEGLCYLAAETGADMVLSAIVGFAGLVPTLRAVEAGKDIALANKETLVTAGKIFMDAVKRRGVRLLPVDSEHCAIFQSLLAGRPKEIHRLLLTASGGPFFGKKIEEMRGMTRERALARPNWSMGAKITIDSATMINKGLEMIEAKWLFDVDIDKIHVLVQPKSVIHSMVGFVDGAVMAQLGTPDMRLPIQYALYYPERNYLGGERLNFEALADIQFEKPNTDVLRGIPIAVEASRIGGSMLTAMNAANEYAVARFLKKDIAFLQIYDMIEYAMSKHRVIKHPDLSQILETERETYERLNKDWRNVSR